MITLNDLHDATLLHLQVDWRNAELRCTFRVQIDSTRTVELLGDQLTHLACSRTNPWGESVSVNEIDVYGSTQERTLKIEMQSGDLIEAKVKNISITKK